MRVPFASVRQSGQAAVETAIILPLLTFLVLGIVQLTMIQQASLMTEYAAYQAARAGVVWNGNVDKMEDAAIVALAPTVPGGSGRLYLAARPIEEGTAGLLDLAADVASMHVTQGAAGALHIPKPIRVDTINPTTAIFNQMATKGYLPKQTELVFDDVGYQSIDNYTDGFKADEAYRKALQLTIRVRYLYEMKIPFADWIIQTCFFAANAPSYLQPSGALGEESIGLHKTAVESGDQNATAGILAAMDKQISAGKVGKPTLTATEFKELFLARELHVYVIPLTASYTLRMQSNFYRKNLQN
ncbi:MAG: pilus assembly protein [Deltaproteobacteria bacterium]|nr:pilus assembly protein [Deltaproteobacteria bacterium]